MASLAAIRLCPRGQAFNLRFLLVLHLTQLLHSGDVKPRKELYTPDYRIYHNLSAVESHIMHIALSHSKYISVDRTFVSLQKRPQLLLRITNFSDIVYPAQGIKVPKVKILLSFGEHAREFLPVEYLFYLLKNITQGISAPKSSYAAQFSRNTLSKVDLFVVPMMNPDGRKYIENTGNYCWRGTSTGVDLNRNFDWQFGHKGSSGSKNDEEYRGLYAFSEPEGKVLRQLTTKHKFDAFVSLHSGIRQIYVPFADTHSRRVNRKPENINAMLDLAANMADASPAHFTYGLAYKLNKYTADGTIFDYMAGVKKIPFSYAVELWGQGDHKGAECFDLFNPKSNDLETVLKDIHPIFVTLFLYMANWKYEQVFKHKEQEAKLPTMNFSYKLLVILMMLILMVALNKRLQRLCLCQRRICVRLYTLFSLLMSMMGL